MLLVTMAGLKEPPPPSEPRIRLALVAGPPAFSPSASSRLPRHVSRPAGGWAKTIIVAIEWRSRIIAVTLAYMVMGMP
jgi:hypothetical protein